MKPSPTNPPPDKRTKAVKARQIIIFPKGTLSERDRRELNKNGYCAVEADDPSKILMPFPAIANVTGDIFAMSALEAIAGDASVNERSLFTRILTRKLQAAKAPAPVAPAKPEDK